MKVLETDRLALRWLTIDDAPFILRLVNEPAWLRFIGDRGVKTVEDARRYVANGPLAMYERFGFGLYLTELKGSGFPIGLCGLIRRDSLPDVDLGFALLPEFWGHGYGVEAASAVLDHGRSQFALTRIVAITSPDNVDSIKLLAKIGFSFERLVSLTAGEPAVNLYARNS
jgi:RimJ/RimL family protein N-acetyltransferase